MDEIPSVPRPENPPAPVASAPAPLFQKLDPRVINLWRITHLIGSAFLLGITLAGALMVGFALRPLMPWMMAAWGALVLLRTWLWFWYPRKAYAAWEYRLDEKVLETRRGVFFKLTQLLPLSRLQHVDLERGPIERYFGLASLVLHTAGTLQASIVIPGLNADEAARLRDRLVAVGGDDAV